MRKAILLILIAFGSSSAGAGSSDALVLAEGRRWRSVAALGDVLDLKPDEIAMGAISKVTFRTIKVLCGNFGRGRFRANVTSASAYRKGERFLLLLRDDGSKVTVHQWRHVRHLDDIRSKISCSKATEQLHDASR